MYEHREEIRGLIAKYFLSYVWLVSQLNKRGVDITPNELCQYVTGRRRGAKAESVLKLSLEILKRYIELYESSANEQDKKQAD